MTRVLSVPKMPSPSGEPSSAVLENRDTGEPLPLREVRMDAVVEGLLLEVECEQRYHNPAREAIEILYTFPVPWGGRLLSVEAWIGERHLRAEVGERVAATARYDEAIGEGHTALLLEDLGHGRWSLSLGNLAAGETCRLRLRYAQCLRFQGDSIRLLIPTVIAPCYGESDAGRGRPYQQPVTDPAASCPARFRVRVRGKLAESAISSPSHVVQSRLRHGEVEITLEQPAWIDRDFVLQLNEVNRRSLALTAHSGEDYWVMASFAPRPPQGGQVARGVKILVDCSGSMGGDSMDAAIRSLSAFIRELGDHDSLSLSRFGSTVEHRSNGLWTLNTATRQAALRWVQGLQADLGGTEMEAALESTFALRCGEVTDVLLVTDGEIGAVEGTIRAARRSGHRLFVVGIGSSPAEPLLRQLADATGGACEFVAPCEDAGAAITRMLNRLGGVRLPQLRVIWPDGVMPLWQSAMPSGAFAGDTLMVWARLAKRPEGSLRLLSGTPATPELLGEAMLMASTAADSVSRMAAAVEAEDLMAAQEEKAALALSLRYGLLNGQTAAVMVMERGEEERLGDSPRQVVVPQMLAAGWGGVGSVMQGASMVRASMPMTRSMISFASSGMADMLDACLVPSFLSHSSPAEHSVECPVQPKHLREQLQSRSRASWPRDYAGLAYVFGLDQALLDWLEWVAAPALGLDEAAMVMLFLTLFNRSEAEAWLSGQPFGQTKDAGLASLATALEGIGRDAWPECIRDMVWCGQ